MENPWLELPHEPPYVLPADRPHVEEFNVQAKPQHYLDLAKIPQPFVGNHEAPLVLLNLNPDIKGAHEGGPVAEAIRANLGSADTQQHRLIGLLPQFDDTPNADWWRKKCSQLLTLAQIQGVSQEDLASRILAVELHGYHSCDWKAPKPLFPSQYYGFWLVEQAIGREATIVVLRGQRHWEEGVQRLKGYRHLVTVSSPQSGYISVKNCNGDGFSRIVEAVTG